MRLKNYGLLTLLLPAAMLALPGSTASLLKRQAGFTDEQLDAVRHGQRVVRMIDTGAQAEIAFAGVIRLPVTLATYLHRVRAGTLYKVRDPILQVGRFGEKPSLNDLNRLQFESYDLKAPVQQNKQWMLNSIRDYETTGDLGFGPLGEAPRHVDMTNHFLPLVQRSGYLRERLPAAYEYLARYPKAASKGADDFYLWTQITFGFRPVTRVAQVSVWEEGTEAVVLTKQIYANRYFQASYQIDHLVSDGDGVYLITLNYGRSEWLEGISGKMIRPLVVSRTKSAAEKTLDQAREDFQQERL